MKYLPVLGIAIFIGIFSLPLHVFAAQPACQNPIIKSDSTKDWFADHQQSYYACGSNDNGLDGEPTYNYYDQSWNPTSGNFNLATGVETSDNGKTSVVSHTCSLIYGYPFDVCIWNPLLAWTGSWFLSAGGALLLFAGYIFDGLVNNVIIGFGSTLETLHLLSTTDSSAGIISTAWTAVRDLANIAIIGIFVYIALRIIVVGRDYGDRRLIARVLIVAVLINFSLLFTKLIIDASNFVAYEIYATATQTSSGSTSSNNQFSIATKFLKPLGITSVWSDTGTLANQVLKKTQSGTISFLFGLFGGILLGILALVILYGAFLIAARAIVFIILMITAPLAFATYLWPSFSEGEFGWSGWWKSLLNNAIFAPLLMLFTAISIGVVNAVQSSGIQMNFGSSLTQMYTSQTATAAAGATQFSSIAMPLVIYMIATGLLFVSFRISHSIAGTASGFNMSMRGMANLIGGPMALLTRGASTRFGRRFLNPMARARADRQEEAGKQAAVRAAETRANLPTGGISKAIAKFGARRDENFAARQLQKAQENRQAALKTRNIMDTRTAGAITRGLGIAEPLSGRTPGGQKGHIERMQKQAQAAIHAAAPVAVTKENAERIANQAAQKVAEGRKDEETALVKELQKLRESRPTGAAQEGEKQPEKEMHGEALATPNKDSAKILTQSATDESRIRKEALAEQERAREEQRDAERKMTEQARKQSGSQANLDEHKVSITAAQREAAGSAIRSVLTDNFAPAKAASTAAALEHEAKEREAEQRLREFRTETVKLQREAAEKEVAAAQKVHENIVKYAAGPAASDLALDKVRIRSSIVQSQQPIVNEIHVQGGPRSTPSSQPSNTNMPPRKAA